MSNKPPQLFLSTPWNKKKLAHRKLPRCGSFFISPHYFSIIQGLNFIFQTLVLIIQGLKYKNQALNFIIQGLKYTFIVERRNFSYGGLQLFMRGFFLFYPTLWWSKKADFEKKLPHTSLFFLQYCIVFHCSFYHFSQL